MNISILISSFRHIKSNKPNFIFSILGYRPKSLQLLVSLARWIYTELSYINYSNEKLIDAFDKNDIDVIKSIIYLNKQKDIENWNYSYEGKHILNELLIDSFSYDNNIDAKIYERVKILLENGADIHLNNDMSLRFACRNNYINIVELLLEAGADVHAHDDEALLFACQNCNIEMAELLLKYGANIHGNYYRILTNAYFISNNIKVVMLLLKYGTNLPESSIKDCQTKIFFELIDLYLDNKKVI